MTQTTSTHRRNQS